MESMGPCCNAWDPASVSAVPSHAAPFPTHSATSNKVRHSHRSLTPHLYRTKYLPGSSGNCILLIFHFLSPGSVGLVSRFGQFYKSVDPGLVQINVCTESLRVVDVKIQISPIGRQKVITRDNVDVEM